MRLAQARLSIARPALGRLTRSALLHAAALLLLLARPSPTPTTLLLLLLLLLLLEWTRAKAALLPARELLLGSNTRVVHQLERVLLSRTYFFQFSMRNALDKTTIPRPLPTNDSLTLIPCCKTLGCCPIRNSTESIILSEQGERRISNSIKMESGGSPPVWVF
jgi:hypothetical protein